MLERLALLKLALNAFLVRQRHIYNAFYNSIFQDEMTNALALMRVDQVTPIKNLDTANNKLLKKRQKRNKSVEGVK